MSYNRLLGEVPVCPNGFLRLQVLDVADNNLKGNLPSVKRWPAIRHLLLHANGFTGNLNELEFNRSQHASDGGGDHYYDDDDYSDDSDDDMPPLMDPNDDDYSNLGYAFVYPLPPTPMNE